MGEKHWRCFHCDEVFTDEETARNHFGDHEGQTPACKLNTFDRGLLEALRRQERDNIEAWDRISSETVEAVSAMHGMHARFERNLRLVDEAAYVRGMRDALKDTPND